MPVDASCAATCQCCVVLQIALAATPLLIGYIRNRSPNYDNVESLLLGGATTTVVLCLLLGCINSNRRGSRGHLNAPTFATIQSPSSVEVRMRCYLAASWPVWFWQLGVQLLYVSNSFLDALVLVACGSRGRPQQEKREALLGTPGRR